ncbi:MAG: hypothetical protein Q8P41_14070 [Pseudomonadota bacterium]|nr:hypothetical protein [Pseudomonadota bacterium]
MRDDDVQVTVTPSDSTGSGSAMTSSAVTIQNALPSVSSVYVTPSTAYTDDLLTVAASGWSDADGDSAGYHYQWYKNSAAVTGATGLTLADSYFVKTDRIYCAVTPDDGHDVGTVRNSPVVTIQNSYPDTIADIATGLTATECDTIELDASRGRGERLCDDSSGLQGGSAA